MPGEAFTWMSRIKDVEREYNAVRYATERLLADLAKDPSILTDQVAPRHIEAASRRLEGTYIVRIFSEFETALGQFLRAFSIRKPKTTEALVNRVRTRGRIPQAETDAVHVVRDYRNVLLHERSRAARDVTLREATSSLCTFLSRVQRIW
jgi:hypothetical protein